MALPAVGGGTPSTMTSGDWWVFRLPPAGGVASKDSAGQWNYVSAQADTRGLASRDAKDRGGTVVAGPYKTQDDANNYISQNGLPTSFKGTTVTPGDLNPVTWLSKATGGVFAAALEQGFVSLLKDIWAVISGPLLVLAGIAVGLIVLAIFFKDDVAELAGIAAKVIK